MASKIRDYRPWFPKSDPITRALFHLAKEHGYVTPLGYLRLLIIHAWMDKHPYYTYPDENGNFHLTGKH